MNLFVFVYAERKTNSTSGTFTNFFFLFTVIFHDRLISRYIHGLVYVLLIVCASYVSVPMYWLLLYFVDSFIRSFNQLTHRWNEGLSDGKATITTTIANIAIVIHHTIAILQCRIFFILILSTALVTIFYMSLLRHRPQIHAFIITYI